MRASAGELLQWDVRQGTPARSSHPANFGSQEKPRKSSLWRDSDKQGRTLAGGGTAEVQEAGTRSQFSLCAGGGEMPRETFHPAVRFSH